MSIIGIGGFAGAGKDEAAKVLVEEFGYSRIAFADVLRDMAYALDPDVYVEMGQEGGWKPLTKVVDDFGWDRAKNEFPSVRRILQRLGTEAGRDILGENIWVDTAFKNAPPGDIVVTDVRFQNELDSIKQRGGTTVYVLRPGVGPRNSHPSETSITKDDFDVVINNDGSLDDLVEKMRSVAVHVNRSTRSS